MELCFLPGQKHKSAAAPAPAPYTPTPDPEDLPEVDIPPPTEGESYKDWSKVFTFTPTNVLCPTSPQELSQMLKDNENKKISVIASAHSCSGNYSSDTVISLKEMPYVLTDLSENKDHSYIRVSANTTFREILVRLAEFGRALPATGGVDEQQLGGLIGTDTTPATKERQIFSGVVSIEYATKDNAVNIAEGCDLNAFIANLGINGVITYINWNTIPDQGFRVIQRIRPVEDLILLLAQGHNFINDEDDDNTEEYTIWRFNWIPDSDYALLWAARQIDTTDPDYVPEGDYVERYRMPLEMHIYNFIAQLTSTDPFCNPILKAVFEIMKVLYENNTEDNTYYGPLRNMLPVDRFVNQKVYCSMAEWAFLPSDIFVVYQLYKNYFKANKWPNLPLEIEYVKCDDYYMSPWNSSKMETGGVPFLVKINMMWYSLGDRREPNFRQTVENHARGLWDILKENNITFKAHWGKINFTTPADVRRLYDWSEFKPFIQPQFLNAYYASRLPSLP
jgi:FAD/FMN-containing dehydrogenases